MKKADSIRITPSLLKRFRSGPDGWACDEGFNEGLAVVGKGLIFYLDPIKNLELADALLQRAAQKHTSHKLMVTQMTWLLSSCVPNSNAAYDTESCALGAYPWVVDPYVLAQMMAMVADFLLYPPKGGK